MHDVVGVAHQGWSVAAGERAVPVADHEGGPDREGDQSFGAADVEWFASGAEDGGDDLGVTRQPPDGRDGQLVTASSARPVRERLEGGGDHEPGWGAVGVGWQVGVQGVLGGLDQGVPHPGTGVAGVVNQRLPSCSSTAGAGAVSGMSAALSRAPSSAEPRPLTPDSAGSVADDREVSAQVGGTFLAVQLPFELPIRGVGVDHMRPDGVQTWRGRWRRSFPACSSRVASPRARTAVPDGSASTDFTITSACSGDTVPAAMASRVDSRGPVRAWARATTRRPSPLRRPPRWVSQSPVDP